MPNPFLLSEFSSSIQVHPYVQIIGPLPTNEHSQLIIQDPENERLCRFLPWYSVADPDTESLTFRYVGIGEWTFENLKDYAEKDLPINIFNITSTNTKLTLDSIDDLITTFRLTDNVDPTKKITFPLMKGSPILSMKCENKAFTMTWDQPFLYSLDPINNDILFLEYDDEEITSRSQGIIANSSDGYQIFNIQIPNRDNPSSLTYSGTFEWKAADDIRIKNFKKGTSIIIDDLTKTLTIADDNLPVPDADGWYYTYNGNFLGIYYTDSQTSLYVFYDRNSKYLLCSQVNLVERKWYLYSDQPFTVLGQFITTDVNATIVQVVNGDKIPLDYFREYFGSYVTEGMCDMTNNEHIIYNFVKGGLGDKTLWCFPEHFKNFGITYDLDPYTIKTLQYGDLTYQEVFESLTLSYTDTLNTNFLAYTTTDLALLSLLGEQLKTYNEIFANPDDIENIRIYNAGKFLYSIVRTLLLAQQRGVSTYYNEVLNSSFNYFMTRLTELITKPEYNFKYETRFGGVCDLADESSNLNVTEDGNTFYYNHHQQYGYFIYVAAAFIQLGKNVFSLMSSGQKGCLMGLVKDVCNYENVYTRRVRHKDFYGGHSWAKGLTSSFNRLESVGESINCYYACFLLGNVMLQNSIEPFVGSETSESFFFLAKHLLELELAAVDQYVDLGVSLLGINAPFSVLVTMGREISMETNSSTQSYPQKAVELLSELYSPYNPIEEKRLLSNDNIDKITMENSIYSIDPDVVSIMLDNYSSYPNRSQLLGEIGTAIIILSKAGITRKELKNLWDKYLLFYNDLTEDTFWPYTETATEVYYTIRLDTFPLGGVFLGSGTGTNGTGTNGDSNGTCTHGTQGCSDSPGGSNDDNGVNDDQFPTWGWIIVVILIILLVALFLYIIYRNTKRTIGEIEEDIVIGYETLRGNYYYDPL